MTTNYHTPIAANSAATAATFNTPLGALDDAITKLSNGNTAITPVLSKLNISTDTTLTISSGAVTAARARHLIDTESSASSDDLDTINGGVEGDIVRLQLANAARVVRVRHGEGNIRLIGKVAAVLSDTNRAITLMYDGSNWVEIVPGILAPQPRLDERNWFAVRAAGATATGVGVASPTASNTPTADNDATGTFAALPTTSTSGNKGGFVSTTFNLVRRAHNPMATFLVKTPSTITSLRYWIGLVSADVTDVDTLAAATEFVGFRYSTVIPDSGWVPVCADNSSQTVGTAIGTLAQSTFYKLRLRVDSAAGIAYFSVNDSAEQEVSANLPQAATELGFCVRVFTQTAAIRQISYSRMYVEYD